MVMEITHKNLFRKSLIIGIVGWILLVLELILIISLRFYDRSNDGSFFVFVFSGITFLIILWGCMAVLYRR